MTEGITDPYCGRDSFFHRLDPRTKLLTALILVLRLLLFPSGSWLGFVLFFIFVSSLLLFSRVPILHVLKRSLVVIPFVLMTAIFVPFFKQGEAAASFNIWRWHFDITHEGLLVLTNTAIKSWLSILCLIWLTATTRMSDIFHAMEKLRLPRVLVMLLSFMYRYIFVVFDEMVRMKQARDSRNSGGGRLRQLRTLGNMIGTLFMRSYERGERVYVAMLSRGYDGQSRILHDLRLSRADAYFGVCLGFAIVLVSLVSLLALK